MKILVIGASGLIGHTLIRELKNSFDVYGMLHHKKENYGNLDVFKDQKIIDDIDVSEFHKFITYVEYICPDVILNCVGVTKRKINQSNVEDVIYLNALFPHKLANWAKNQTTRIIHFSTDCVFDGHLGNYNEKSITTAKDLYGRTKALGEIFYNNTLTLRSSFIGQEIFDRTELLDWFLSQTGNQIIGYKNTFYSGVSTIFMAKVVECIIMNYPELSGLYQLATEKPISKYDLLSIAKEVFDIELYIDPDVEHCHNPTLDGSKLKNAINLSVPSWKEMMEELRMRNNFYSKSFKKF